MRDHKAQLISVSSKRKHTNFWNDVDADLFEDGSQMYIKLYLTHRDFQHHNFPLEGGCIVLDDQVYQIESITYDPKRPKYTNCRVTELVA